MLKILAVTIPLALFATVGCSFAVKSPPKHYYPTQGPPDCSTSETAAKADAVGAALSSAVTFFGAVLLVSNKSARDVSGKMLMTLGGKVVRAGAKSAGIYFYASHRGFSKAERCRRLKKIYKWYIEQPKEPTVRELQNKIDELNRIDKQVYEDRKKQEEDRAIRAETTSISNDLRALSVRKKALGASHHQVALGHFFIAKKYRAAGATVKAHTHFLIALGIFQKNGNKEWENKTEATLATIKIN